MYTLWGGDCVIIVFVAPAPSPSAVPPKLQELPLQRSRGTLPLRFHPGLGDPEPEGVTKELPRHWRSPPAQSGLGAQVGNGRGCAAGWRWRSGSGGPRSPDAAGGLGLGRRMRTVVMTTPPQRPGGEKEYVEPREGGPLGGAPIPPSRSHYSP